MRGRLVRLERPDDADYQLIEGWMASDAPVAPLTGDLGADLSAEELKQANTGGHRFYVIRLLTDDTAVGTVNFRREGPGWFSVGGAVGDPQLWQRGYAADALMLLVDFLFHTCNARKVTATVMAFNRGSLRMITRSGFVCEGILREHCYLDGRWHDAVLWSMLRSEFYAQVARDAALSEQLALRDLVDEAEKERARRVLAEHLESATTSISQFVARTKEARP